MPFAYPSESILHQSFLGGMELKQLDSWTEEPGCEPGAPVPTEGTQTVLARSNRKLPNTNTQWGKKKKTTQPCFDKRLTVPSTCELSEAGRSSAGQVTEGTVIGRVVPAENCGPARKQGIPEQPG